MISADDLQNRFTYHPPKDNDIEKYQMLRNIGLSIATVINELVPDSREKALAITKLEEVVFWANAGIARNREAEVPADLSQGATVTTE